MAGRRETSMAVPRAARQARAVITISPFSRERRTIPGRPGGPVRVIPLGVGLSEHADRRERWPWCSLSGPSSIAATCRRSSMASGRLAATRCRDLRLEVVGANRTHPPLLPPTRWPRRPRRVAFGSGAGWTTASCGLCMSARRSLRSFRSTKASASRRSRPWRGHSPGRARHGRRARGPRRRGALRRRPDRCSGSRCPAGGAWPWPERRGLQAATGVLARYDWRLTAAATLAVLEESARP